MGPLVSEEQLNRVTGYLDAGRAEGAKALCGGQRMGEKGYFVEPTVLVNTSESMKVVQEEIFGPVVTAMPFHKDEEILPRANDTVYGLGGRRLDARYQQGTPDRLGVTRRHRVDQLLQHLRRGSALRRLQAVGLGTRDGTRRPRDVYGNQGSLHKTVNPEGNRGRNLTRYSLFPRYLVRGCGVCFHYSGPVSTRSRGEHDLSLEVDLFAVRMSPQGVEHRAVDIRAVRRNRLQHGLEWDGHILKVRPQFLGRSRPVPRDLLDSLLDFRKSGPLQSCREHAWLAELKHHLGRCRYS